MQKWHNSYKIEYIISVSKGSEILTKNKRSRAQEDEIPKSVLKMKQEKERREEAERAKREGRNGKTAGNKKDAKRSKNDKKKKLLKKVILFIIIVAIIILAISLGVSAYSWKVLSEDMFVNEHSTVIDKEGNVIAELGNEQKKIKTDISEMPQYLLDAYVSIEDERYYSHHGIDIRRTGGAILSYVTHFGNSSYGGSTITQQLVKNLTGDDTGSVTRKVKEWWKAFLLESYFTKEEILEMYLNVIYVGPNIYGVGAGAEYYFSKDVSNLSLAECAYLAGINNSPNSYNPFGDSDNNELIEDRTLTVLQKMLELGEITESEYNEAETEVKNGLDFDEGSIDTGDIIYSYHTDALITDVINDLAEEKNISTEFAQNYLYLSGATIYSTQNSEIQDKVESEFLKNQYVLYSSDGETTSQAAMVIMNHQTGEVLACTGGLGEKETFRGLNRATQSQRQTGSSIKPLAVLAPGIDKKIFTASTIYNDKKTTFSDGYAPGNNSGYLGEITVRRALESSQNIPFVEMMEQVTPRRAISYLENMGITSLTPEDESLALALGGLQHGITPLEMAGAYATIANDGVYIEPTFYTSIVNSKGRSVLEAKQETRTVFSEQVAFVLKQLLKQPVEGRYGTATYCSISGIDVAAKTGTTDDNYDKWLCGFTPYYTAVTWYGFDNNESIYYYNQNPAGIIWANVMRSVHNGLTGARFTEPSWITTAEICADTGMLARTGCTNTYTEYYLWGTEPDLCTKHSGSKVSASQSTQDDEEKVYVDDDNDLKLNPNDEEEAPEVEPTNIIEEENTVDDEPIDVPENNTVEEENNVDSGSNNNNAESENTVIDDTPSGNEDNEEEPEPPRENTTVPEPPQENDTTVADEPADSEE